jgi:hypothetical protein
MKEKTTQEMKLCAPAIISNDPLGCNLLETKWPLKDLVLETKI